MRHHTKDKGDIATAKVIADLTEKGFVCFTAAVSEHMPFDLIAADENMKLVKVQVKYRTKTRGSLHVSLFNTASTSKGRYTKAVNRSEIDAYAIYCPDTSECYYVRMDSIADDVGMFSLSLSEPTPQTLVTSRFAKDCRNPASMFGKEA